MIAKQTSGRVVLKLSSQIKEDISNDAMNVGDFLPSVRSLSQIHRVSTKTVHRALKLLESEGLLVAKPRQGYQVAATLKKNSGVIGFVTSDSVDTNIIERLIYLSLQKEASKRGWSVLVIPSDMSNTIELKRQLENVGATGIIVGQVDATKRNQLKEFGIPAITLEAWNEYTEINEITRDEHQGSFEATNYLINKGHKHFAWIGEIKNNNNGAARFGSIQSTLLKNDLLMEDKYIFEIIGRAFSIDQAKKIWKSIKEPIGIFTPWRHVSITMAQAAKELGIKFGEDFDQVGWTIKELFNQGYANKIPELASKCANCIWSTEEISQITLNRLEDLSRNPFQKAYRISVPMEFRLPRPLED